MSVLSKRLFGASLLAVSLALVGCGEVASEQVVAPPAPAVDVAPVIHREVVHYEHFTGRLQAPERVEVRPRVSGYVNRVAFAEGQTVEAGQLLFEIDPRPFKVEVDRQQAILKGALTNARLASQEYERAQRLIDSRAIAREQLDLRQARAQESAAAVAAARAALEQAQLNLDYTHITAPIAGAVSLARVTAGNLVSASDSVLTTLVATDRVYAYFDMDEQTYLRYRAGARSDVQRDPAPSELVRLSLVNEADYPHQGQLDFLDNQVDPGTGTLRARAVFDNSDNLFTPGLYARLAMVSGAPAETVLIDERAVGTDLSNKFVLVLNPQNNVVDYRAVTLGERIGGLRAVTAGLEGSETIVVNGLQRVRPGSPVAPEPIEMADADTLRALAKDVALVTRAQAGQEAIGQLSGTDRHDRDADQG